MTRPVQTSSSCGGGSTAEAPRGFRRSEASAEVFESYAERLGGCCVLLASQQSCLDVLRSLQQSVAALRRQGLPAPARVTRLISLLECELAEHGRSDASANGSPEVPDGGPLPVSVLSTDPAGVEEAALVLGVSPRQVRNLAERLEGRKVGRTWTFDRGALEDEATRRQERRSAWTASSKATHS